MGMLEFGYYFAFTLPVAVAVWALIEWRQQQRHKRAPACPHPRLKRVYVLHDGRNVPTDDVQCVQCKQRMKG